MGKQGSMLILLSIFFSMIVGGIVYLLYRSNISQQIVERTIKREQRLLYLADIGIAYALAEENNHGFLWFTHKILPDKTLQKNPSVPPPSLQNVYINANGEYVVIDDPDKQVVVKTYQDSSGTTWILSKATIDGQIKIIRLAIGTRSLYDYFAYYCGDHFFGGGTTFDGRGFGKIYVNGRATFESPVFKNIAELSTNSTGTFAVYSANKDAPYTVDMGYYDGRSGLDPDHAVDGYAFLRTFYGGELGFPSYTYPSDLASERGFGPKEVWGIFKPVDRCFSGSPKFIFDPNVMNNDLANKIGLTSYTELKMPRQLYTSSGDPANWDYDLYHWDDKGTGLATNETSVKFVRLYYVDEDGHAHIIGNPDKAPPGKTVYAQVYDKKDTSKETSTIHFLGRDIPVREDGVTYVWKDKNGNEHSVKFDPAYEKYFWDHGQGWYPSPSNDDYIKNGYYRNSETVPVNYLNTSHPEQQSAFRDWLTGNYHRNPDDQENNTTLDLSYIIHEHSTGAKDIHQPEISTSFSNMAMFGGIWIGYEGDKLKVCTGVTGSGTPNCHIYDNPDDWPDWISPAEFYAGAGGKGINIKNPDWNNTKAKTYYLRVIDIDLQKAIPVLQQTNGIIWLNPTNDDQKYGYDGIRIINGETIPRNGGITVVSPRNILVKGPLNKHDPQTDPAWQPTALITDSYVVMLSSNFPDPRRAPAYTYFPHPGGTNNEKWYEYLMYRFEEDPNDGFSKDDFWPMEGDDPLTLKKKINAITKKIKEYIDNRQDTEFCDIDINEFERIFSENPYNPSQIVKAINLAFTKLHHPDYGTDEDKAMPLNHSGDYFLGASIVSSQHWCKSGSIQFLENRGWWYTGQYPDSDLIWQGSSIGIPGSWSGEAVWYGGTYDPFGGKSYTPAKTQRIAVNYAKTGNYPPGNFAGGVKFIWYIEDDPEAFNKHPY